MFHWRALSCLRWLWDADYYQGSSSCLSWLSISILGHVSVNCALSILTKHPFTFSIWMVQTSENNSRFLRKFALSWSRSLDCIWYFKTCRENLAKLRGGEIIFPLLTKARRSIDGYLTSWAVLSLSRSACSQESLRVKPLPLGCCGNATGVLNDTDLSSLVIIMIPWFSQGLLHISSKHGLTSIGYEYLCATTENAAECHNNWISTCYYETVG